MRVQGGSTGLIAALSHGVIDPLNAGDDRRDWESRGPSRQSLWRKLKRHERDRLARINGA